MPLTRETKMNLLRDNRSSLHKRIKDVSNACERKPESIKILAVSKKHSLDLIKIAYSCGLRHFGENYVQEALGKIQYFNPPDINWHFIGPIQSNKTRAIANNFSWVHSVDRLKIAERLSAQKKSSLADINICIQVNVDDEKSKSGFSMKEAVNVVPAIKKLPGIKLRGLMAIPQLRRSLNEQREPFKKLNDLFNEIAQEMDDDSCFDTLSMGMSSDLEAAIYENTNIVRVGTDIFGPRE